MATFSRFNWSEKYKERQLSLIGQLLSGTPANIQIGGGIRIRARCH